MKYEQIKPIGNCEIRLIGKMPMEDVAKLHLEKGHIFELAGVSWSPDGTYEVHLVPGNGMLLIVLPDEVRYLCPHGKPPGDCDDCDRESDFQFDCQRERETFGRSSGRD